MKDKIGRQYSESSLERLAAQIKPEDQRFTDLAMQIAARVYIEMKRRGMTHDELAQALGMQRAHVTRFLSGTDNPTLKTVAKIETALGVTLIPSTNPVPGVSKIDINFLEKLQANIEEYKLFLRTSGGIS